VTRGSRRDREQEAEQGQSCPEPQHTPAPIALDRGDIGVRVDLVLNRHLGRIPGISRNRIQKLVDRGAVLINGVAASRPSRRIAAGDVLSVMLPPRRAPSAPAAEALPLDIAYEDDDLLVVNKAAGQVCHPAFRHSRGTLINALLAHAAGEWTPALITRLDKDTSGLVLVAKSAETQRVLQRLGAERRIDKDYLAVVRGRPPARGSIELALGRDPWDGRRVRAVDRGGSPSVTTFARLECVRVTPREEWSLLRCRLITGRTHQIRVHLAAKGWPIVGDSVYGVRSPHIARQALHAWRVTFEQPRTSELVEAEAVLPADMARLLDAREIEEHGAER
jgi:23S rRNA pseudouridine1911/1915/1917 synthase